MVQLFSFITISLAPPKKTHYRKHTFYLNISRSNDISSPPFANIWGTIGNPPSLHGYRDCVFVFLCRYNLLTPYRVNRYIADKGTNSFTSILYCD